MHPLSTPARAGVAPKSRLNNSKGTIKKPVKSDFRVNFDGFCPAVLSRLRDSVQREFVCPVQQPAVEFVLILFILGKKTKTPAVCETTEITLNSVGMHILAAMVRLPGRPI
jgi:hypothetical protein